MRASPSSFETPPDAARVGVVLDRDDAIDRAAGREVDVLVVGGGITGCGVALDAATRGYRVALVERGDLAAGTSSRSSKLVHGGIRYLANGDLAMVAEGVRERDRVRRLAPHLVRPLGFTVPVDDAVTGAKLRAGMSLYDSLALGRSVARHRRISLAQVLEGAPGLVRGASRGGLTYHDCRADDARLTLEVALAAARYGALVVTHAEVVELTMAGDRVTGAVVRDRLSGADVRVRSRWVVSATGVWADRVRGLAPDAAAPALVPSRGVHLTFDRRELPAEAAVIVPSGADDDRMVFVIPWGEQVYVGTTDDLHGGGLDDPAVALDDAAYLVGSVNAAFGLELRVEDAVGAWAGLRPLRAGAPDAATADLSRRHAIVESPSGLVTITGGKLTTFRQMAEDVVDRLAAADGNRRPCATTRLSLGSAGDPAAGSARLRALATTLGTDPDVGQGLYDRHGDRAPAVLRACVADGEDTPLVAGLPYLTGEVRWAVRHEWARSVGDVLDRRMRVSLRDAAAGGAAIELVGDVLAAELGWDRERRDEDIAAYRTAVARERGPVPLRSDVPRAAGRRVRP